MTLESVQTTKNSSINIAHANQTGIGLPDRDYYFKSDSSTVAIQNAYKTYLTHYSN
jgi:putative endopeptidase